MVLSRKYRLVEAALLAQLDQETLLKLIGKEDETLCDSDNSDEDSSTMESDEDSDEYRRPTTIVHLVT